jgi:hypothetical protein
MSAASGLADEGVTISVEEHGCFYCSRSERTLLTEDVLRRSSVLEQVRAGQGAGSTKIACTYRDFKRWADFDVAHETSEAVRATGNLAPLLEVCKLTHAQSSHGHHAVHRCEAV